MEVLDVGCGSRPTGDVNTDLTYGGDSSAPYRGSVEIKNFVRCDAGFLPFKDSAFRVVFASHVLEHLQNPEMALLEWLRVASKKVEVYVPHRYGDAQHNPKHHKHKFNATWFLKFGAKYKVSMRVEYSRYLTFPFIPLVRFFPSEIRVGLYK